jgi:signal transduction histidine kinase
VGYDGDRAFERVPIAELAERAADRVRQRHGVSVEQVPSYETASMTIDRDTGQKIRRAAAVLTSNALNAGAGRVGYEVDIADDHIRLSVTDDAGGFDRSTVDRGRGLWGLEHELGDGAVEVERLDDGSRVTATVHTTIGRDHGAAAPRR